MADHKKIKTCFAQIIVEEIAGKPYYSIMYWNENGMHIGYSSYELENVRRWLNEEFEVNRNADVAPVVHGKWIRPHWKGSDYCCDCSECDGEAMHREYQWNKKGIYPICPHCGAKMDGGAVDD